VTKPITTIEVVSSVLGMLKTGLVVVTMMLLEFAKMEKAKAKLGEALAKNDLEIEKAKNEKTDKPDSAVVDEYLASKMLHGTGNVDPSSDHKRP
jgi:hypothetical protein